jgi:hypothetical protein
MRPLADVTGTATTVVAGFFLGALGISAFGPAPTFFAFVTLFLLAATTHRAICRHR